MRKIRFAKNRGKIMKNVNVSETNITLENSPSIKLNR